MAGSSVAYKGVCGSSDAAERKPVELKDSLFYASELLLASVCKRVFVSFWIEIRLRGVCIFRSIHLRSLFRGEDRRQCWQMGVSLSRIGGGRKDKARGLG